MRASNDAIPYAGTISTPPAQAANGDAVRFKRCKHLCVTILAAFVFLSASLTMHATDYYVDPATGSMSNDGSFENPWSTLEDVFAAGKTFVAGDVIFLRDGYHGFPTVTGHHSGNVTIQPQSGHVPEVKKLIVDDASWWVISGLTVSPEVVGSYEKGTFVVLNSNTSNVTVKDCFIYSTTDSSGWTAQNWVDRAGNGISIRGDNQVVTNNHVLNTNFSITAQWNGVGAEVSYNTVENFSGDGLRGLGNYQKFEYNIVMNAYNVDDNHDDGFQSWTGGHSGIPVGEGTIYGVVLRGNMFFNQTDPNQPHTGALQGIGNFDGFFEDWVVENNLVVTNHWHGITFLGATNCRIVNNTVVRNPIPGGTSGGPWIRIGAHKNGTPSTGNLIRNNLVTQMNNDSGIGTIDFNIVTTDYESHFVDYTGFDFHLKETSSAVDAGTTDQAPLIDLDQNLRSEPFDVGCYEFGGEPPDPDTEPPTAPENLIATAISQSEIDLEWDASTDNVGVAGYDIYRDSVFLNTTTDTFYPDSGLDAETTYSYVVHAFDEADNLSDPSNTAQATTLAAGSVMTSTSAYWQTVTMSEQTGTFTAEFDAEPHENDMDGVTGILLGTASGYDDLACIFRFNKNGQMDVRNGGSYTADATMNYSAGTVYHVRMEIDVPNDQYSVYVTPEGELETALAVDYSFRTQQVGVGALDSWALYAFIGSHTVSNMSFEATDPPDTEPPTAPENLTATAISQSEIDLEWDASTDNVGVAGYDIYRDSVFLNTTTETFYRDSGLDAETTYSYVVHAFDDADNLSDPSNTAQATTLAAGSVMTSTSDYWQTVTMSEQTGTFTAEFDAEPHENDMDGVTGILLGTASGYNDLACIFRFNPNGQLDVRNGGSYTADSTMNYSAGTVYHVRMEIDVPNDEYSVYVTPEGGSETALAVDYSFRTQQVGVGALDSWALYAESGSHTVSSMSFTASGPQPYPPNLLTNGNFDSFETNGIATSWSILAQGDTVYTASEDTGLTGSAQKIEISSSPSWGLVFHQDPGFVNDTSYEWRIRYKTGGSNTIKAEVANTNFSEVVLNVTLPATNGEWSEEILFFTHDNPDANLLRIATSNEGDFWLDGMALFED